MSVLSPRPGGQQQQQRNSTSLPATQRKRGPSHPKPRPWRWLERALSLPAMPATWMTSAMNTTASALTQNGRSKPQVQPL